MSLRIRRGTNAERLQTALDLGEIAYTTDTKQLYVGDGVTLGGNNILSTSAGTGLAWDNTLQRLRLSTTSLTTSDITEGANLYYTPERAQDATWTALNNEDHVGISFTYDDSAHKIIAEVTQLADQEDVQDKVATLFTAGVHNGISFVYNDENNRIDATVTVNQEDVQDYIAPLFTGVGSSHVGISFDYNDSSNKINATVDVFPADSEGNLYNDGSGVLSWRGFSITDDITPTLGGDLDLNLFDITGQGNVSITGKVACTSQFELGTLEDPELTINLGAGIVNFTPKTGYYMRNTASRMYFGSNTSSSRLYVFSYDDPGANALILRSYNGIDPSDPAADPINDPKGNTISLVRSRGTGNPTEQIPVEDQDEMHTILYACYDGTNVAQPSIKVSAHVDGPVSDGIVPGKYEILTANRTTGVLVSALTIDSLQTVTAHKAFKFPTYADPTSRDSAIPDPEAGMVVFLTDTTGIGGPAGLQLNTDNTTSGWVGL